MFGFLGPNGAGKTTTLKLLMQLVFPRRVGARFSAARRRPRGQAAGRLPARKPVLLRLSDGRGAADLLRARSSACAGRSAARASRACSTTSGSAPSDGSSCAVLQGNGAARRYRPGACQRTRGGVPRRADVGPRSARPPRRAAADVAAPRSRVHGLLQLAHPLRRRVALQPCRHPGAGTPGCVGPPLEILAFELRGWEVVVADLDDAVRARSRRVRGITRSPTAATRSSSGRTHHPSGSSRELAASGAQVVSLNPLRETLEDYFVQGSAPARTAPRDGAEPRESRARSPRRASSRNRSAIACSTGWSAFAVLLIGGVVPDRPADGGPGPEDHQGSRPGGDLLVRPPDRDLHRHRPGVEGSRASQHLCAAGQADPPRRSSFSASMPAWSSPSSSTCRP